MQNSIYINNELKEKAIEEIISYKKETGKPWEKVIKYLLDVDLFFEELHDNNHGGYKLLETEILEEAKKRYNLSSDSRGIVTRHEKWCWPNHLYTDYYWNKFKEMMSGWNDTRWKTVESQTFDIVNNLSDPRKQMLPAEDKTIKGLVYGNVQSGKTAHIASLIALYTSMGCDLIIVFSGVTKSLRIQTENRLRNDLGIDRWGTFDLITAETDLLSRKTPRIEGKLYGRKMPPIGVFKKSPAALRRLLNYLKDTNDVDIWRGKQVLIIDDECDQYSPNNKEMYTDEEDAGMDCDRSTINGLLVSIMNVFDRYCYVGFTATPFANILNEIPGRNSIYPKDFIYPLEQNQKYYGAQKIFGSSEATPDSDPVVLNAIRYIERDIIDPKLNSYQELPSEIRKAIYYFIVGTACKYYRGMEKDHSTCLLHVDLKRTTHSVVTASVNRFVQDIKEYGKDIQSSLERVWEEERRAIDLITVAELFGYSKTEMKKYKNPDYYEMEYFVRQVINKLEVIKDNSDVRMEDRLSYPVDHSSVYIVIGGNTLSRGLTLEGLLVSIFFRSTSTYDTLLQMGRWFGYRIGYEDLGRIYTTPIIAFKYSELATVEENLSQEFEKYSLDVTPAMVSTRVRQMPMLQITRKSAMQAAISTGINYSGSRPSTLFFPHYDKKWLEQNLNITKEFLVSLDKSWRKYNKAFLYESIPIEKIIEYVNRMNIHMANQTCNKELIISFLKKALKREFLLRWNIAVLSNETDTAGTLKLTEDISVNLIERSRLNRHNPEEETVYIKVLQQPNNMLVDTDLMSSVPDKTPLLKKFVLRHNYFESKGMEEPGLMVIYPISKLSKPHNNKAVQGEQTRIPLDTPEHVIGLMFVFPHSKDIELDEYMTINLPQRMDVYEE